MRESKINFRWLNHKQITLSRCILFCFSLFLFLFIFVVFIFLVKILSFYFSALFAEEKKILRIIFQGTREAHSKKKFTRNVINLTLFHFFFLFLNFIILFFIIFLPPPSNMEIFYAKFARSFAAIANIQLQVNGRNNLWNLPVKTFYPDTIKKKVTKSSMALFFLIHTTSRSVLAAISFEHISRLLIFFPFHCFLCTFF